MKIGILTHYNVNNQGAQLQMYATNQKLKEMGHTPIILTYDKNFDFVDKDIKKRNIVTFASIPYFIKEFLFKKGIKLTWFNFRKYIKNRKFRKVTFEYGDYAKTFTDCTIVGSDEVFSIDYGVNKMMYGYGVNTKKLISYAPSFGQTSIDIINKYNVGQLMASGLNKFSALSSRDENTQNIIRILTGIDTKIVCDPVLLYDFSNIHSKIKKIKKRYIIIYSYDRQKRD